MPSRLSWDGSSIVPKSRVVSWLVDPPPALREWVPPGTASWENAFRGRQRYVHEYIDRKALAKSLADSHKRRGAPEAVLSSIAHLEQDDTWLVLTGQQPGLGGGPLFTVYKAIHTIVMARRLSKTHSGRFFPAFWNASEDHDFDEIRHVHWFDHDREIQRFSLDPIEGQPPFFLTNISPDDVNAFLKSIQETTHPSEFRNEVIAILRNCLMHSSSVADCFDQLLWQWLGEEGLIIIRPDDDWIRRGSVPLMRHEILNPKRSTKHLEDVSEILLSLKETPQIHKRADRTAFFVIQDNQRVPVLWDADGFQIDEKKHSKEEMLAWLEDEPHVFSSSAILRPVVQDALLPGVASILGPGEMAYHIMLKGLYDDHAVPRPVVVPRIGFTMVESRDERAFRATGTGIVDLPRDDAFLAKRWTREHSPSSPDVKQVEEAVREFYASMGDRADLFDPTVRPSLDQSCKRAIRELHAAEGLVVRRQAMRNEQVLRQIREVKTALYPRNNLQEREMSFLHFWLKYGPPLLRDLIREAETTEDGEHVFLRIP